MMLRVFAQLTPEPTGEYSKPRPGDDQPLKWHRARLIEVGYAKNWADAKKLTRHPITEQVTDRIH